MKNMAANPDPQHLHISVGVQPTGDLDLEKEIQMVKAALLYGDKVKLYSPKLPSIHAISRFNDFSPELRLKFLERIIPYLSPVNAQKLSSSLDDYKQLLGRDKLDVHELQRRREFERKLEQEWGDIAEQVNEFVRESQLDQIDSVVKAGVLELHDFRNSADDSGALDLMIENMASSVEKGKSLQSGPDKLWVAEFVKNISRSVSDDATYPLLDNAVGNQVAPDMAGMDKGRQAQLAGYLLQRLPLFDKASVNEILDIRRELDKPLTHFRSAIIDYSEDIKSTPWDRGFPPEAEKIYLRDVKPAMLDMEEAVQSNKFLANLIRKLAEKPIVLQAGSFLSIVVSQLSSLPKELVTGLGISLASAPLIYEAYEEWSRKNRDIRQNKLYFYYSAGKHLNKLH
jgi:hypothetical protein